MVAGPAAVAKTQVAATVGVVAAKPSTLANLSAVPESACCSPTGLLAGIDQWQPPPLPKTVLRSDAQLSVEPQVSLELDVSAASGALSDTRRQVTQTLPPPLPMPAPEHSACQRQREVRVLLHLKKKIMQALPLHQLLPEPRSLALALICQLDEGETRLLKAAGTVRQEAVVSEMKSDLQLLLATVRLGQAAWAPAPRIADGKQERRRSGTFADLCAPSPALAASPGLDLALPPAVSPEVGIGPSAAVRKAGVALVEPSAMVAGPAALAKTPAAASAVGVVAAKPPALAKLSAVPESACCSRTDLLAGIDQWQPLPFPRMDPALEKVFAAMASENLAAKPSALVAAAPASSDAELSATAATAAGFPDIKPPWCPAAVKSLAATPSAPACMAVGAYSVAGPSTATVGNEAKLSAVPECACCSPTDLLAGIDQWQPLPFPRMDPALEEVFAAAAAPASSDAELSAAAMSPEVADFELSWCPAAVESPAVMPSAPAAAAGGIPVAVPFAKMAATDLERSVAAEPNVNMKQEVFAAAAAPASSDAELSAAAMSPEVADFELSWCPAAVESPAVMPSAPAAAAGGIPVAVPFAKMAATDLERSVAAEPNVNMKQAFDDLASGFDTPKSARKGADSCNTAASAFKLCIPALELGATSNAVYPMLEPRP
ncbi:hypothetical protein GPECTOR_49g554 [Gonium pectorale]|uniref:Uncharacterized protein n=1 Tax=Gonium pectorale TaxID=33097 RepID=A0A150G9D9_GONPE|nr:hypothetical protein GPECTOR_49g554 [Gonium pectorale]|eukprot:KXZ45970.1 hypothetical protein GPECTOR_49g554 [Gonium pectorale]